MSQPPAYQDTANSTLLGSSAFSDNKESVVVEYMLSTEGGMDGKTHPALNTQDPKVDYDSQTKKFVEAEHNPKIYDAEIYKDADAEKDCFQEAMDEYLEFAKSDPKCSLDLAKVENVRPDECWKVIMESIVEVQKKYEVDTIKTPWGKVRKAFRKLGDNSGTFQSWLGLLPTESHYLSILCGGLKLILGAAARLRKMNDEVVLTLCKIPTCMDKCQRLSSIHKDADTATLRRLSSDLYKAILQAMGGILAHYRQSAGKRVRLSLGKQNRYGSDLISKIEQIDICSAAIVEESDILSKWTATDTNVVAKATLTAVGTLERTVSQSQEETTLAIRSLEVTVSANDRAEREEARKDRAQAAKMRAETIMMLSQVKELLYASPRLNDTSQPKIGEDRLGVAAPSVLESRPGTPVPAEIGAETSRMTRKIFLSRLRYTGMKPKADILANLDHVLHLKIKQQNRVVYIMEKLQPFLGAVSSSLLLIKGSENSSQNSRTPLSFVCAKLASALRDVRKAKQAEKHNSKMICLSFFCGEHRDWLEDPDLACPAGILNSLIVQLVTQFKSFDYASLEDLEKFNNQDISAMCQILGKLLRQLPVDYVVFCIVERLCEYNDDDREEETEALMANLIELFRQMDDKKQGCTLKLLVTANRDLTLDAIESLEDYEQLRVPENAGSRGGFSALQWDSTIGQDIEEMSSKSS